MRAPTIPETLRICATCSNALAMAGQRECCDCLLETRFAVWALADGELPCAAMRPPAPRITEVPQQPKRELWRGAPHSTQAELVARRVIGWVGLLVLIALTCGWLFGRFA
jgi:hypothetical protein